MDKRKLKAEMERFVGGSAFIHKNQLAHFLGLKDPNSCNKYLAGLDTVGERGRGKNALFFIPEVCERIMNYGRMI